MFLYHHVQRVRGVIFPVLLSLLLTMFTQVPASAADVPELSPATVMETSNGSGMKVQASSDGNLSYSENGGTTWIPVSLTMTRNGISSLTWTGNYFIASSYFGGSYSLDGKIWKRFTSPVGSKFTAGRIIEDAEFFQRGSLTAKQIQTFLASQISSCTVGYTCLKDYVTDTFTVPANVFCNEYVGAAGEAASTIIAKVSTACGVSAEALIVLLQKEQGLVTATSPPSWKYQTATGFACPDTSGCDSNYYGFFNQVYHAAKQFVAYSNPVGSSEYYGWYPVGATSQILWSTNSSCGKGSVYIENQATAGLYYYTPYQPNTASLNSFYGTGDTCSEYGNRNFWRYYNMWFSKTKNYATYVVNAGGVFYMIDRDGSVASSTNVSSWKKLSNLVLSAGKQVTGLSVSVSQQPVVSLSDGTSLTTSNGGVSWTGVVAPTPSPTPTPTTSPTPSPAPVLGAPVIKQVTVAKYYTVVSGDTLSAIGAKFGKTVTWLTEKNGISNPNLIYVGQTLTVGYQTVSQYFHRVVKGDTLASVALVRNTTTSVLLKLNVKYQTLPYLKVDDLVRYK